jgi:hypothetical protein
MEIEGQGVGSGGETVYYAEVRRMQFMYFIIAQKPRDGGGNEWKRRI